MIDQKMEPYYDILISIFLGICLIIAIHSMYDSPRVLVIEDDSEKFKNTHRCTDLSM